MEFGKVQVSGISVRDDKIKIGNYKGIRNIKLGVVRLDIGCECWIVMLRLKSVVNMELGTIV